LEEGYVNLDGILEQIRKEVPRSANTFYRKNEVQRLMERRAALELGLFTLELTRKLLNRHVVGDEYISPYILKTSDHCRAIGVKQEDIVKPENKCYQRIYLTENGVKAVINYLHEKKKMRKYNAVGVAEELKAMIS
jgi:hypothetical protein